MKDSQNKWSSLQREYPSLKSVDFFAYTGLSGCLGVHVNAPISNGARLRLYEFILSYGVNRPVKIYDYQLNKE
jgi:hypothetical protein